MDYSLEPRLVAWEATRACNLACVHCRAEAQLLGHPDQLKTHEVKKMIDQIAAFARPIFIVTGGEPMMRPDIYELAAYGNGKGFHVVMSPNGTLITPESIANMKAAGVKRISVSLDGSSPARNNSFRMVENAFEDATRGIAYAREGGMPFQINTTITRRNVDDLPQMLRTVIDLGAITWDVFMLVPTGRGKIEDEVPPEQYEEVLNSIYDVSKTSPVPIKVTCGPHYMRVARQRLSAERKEAREAGVERPEHPHGAVHPHEASHLPFGSSRGCMAGNGFVFVSHVGDVYPCGYFPINAGNVRERHFRDIYRHSDLFDSLRDDSGLGGKCGACEFKKVCFGCRARALSIYGDYMAEEPYCIYEPEEKLAR